MSSAAWSIVVPVKRLAVAKSRLATVAGALREELALAFALDAIAAAAACPRVGRLVVVTDEPAARDGARALGAMVVEDRPDAGLNPALVHGAQAARPGDRIAALSADLPALTPAALNRALALAEQHRCCIVPDLAGTGTTMYAAASLPDFRPAYGPASAARHRELGAVVLDDPHLWPLRQDVDTAEDLHAAMEMGVGPRTADVLRRLPLELPAAGGR